MKTQLLITIVSIVLFSCQSKLKYDNIEKESLKMVDSFYENNPHQTRSSIPKKYWSDSIKKLHPINVESYGPNITIIQKQDNNQEQGLYVLSKYSSVLPVNNSSWTYIHIKNHLYRYTKLKNKKP
jgi:hypothetical protein